MILLPGRLRCSPTFVYRPPTGLKPYAGTGKGSTASESTTSGASVLSGRTGAQWRSKSPPTTRRKAMKPPNRSIQGSIWRRS